MTDNIGKRYYDLWGDVWVRINTDKVKRVKDNCIGSWQDGEGLMPK